jgi:hypothetical protein
MPSSVHVSEGSTLHFKRSAPHLNASCVLNIVRESSSSDSEVYGYVIILKLMYCSLKYEGKQNRHTSDLFEHKGFFSLHLHIHGTTYP